MLLQKIDDVAALSLTRMLLNHGRLQQIAWVLHLCHIMKFEVAADQVADGCILAEVSQLILISWWVMLLLHVDTLSALRKAF